MCSAGSKFLNDTLVLSMALQFRELLGPLLVAWCKSICNMTPGDGALLSSASIPVVLFKM